MDSEKVIKGLEEAEIMLIQAVDRGGEMAVMGAFKCLNRVTDAISLLKEEDQSKKDIHGGYPLIEPPLELIRCKDCIHWDKGHTEECDNLDSVCFHNGWCKPDWFCADGERNG